MPLRATSISAELEFLGIAQPQRHDLLPGLGSAADDGRRDRVLWRQFERRGRIRPDRRFVELGFDHTDRKLDDVSVSERMYDKPIASLLWELEEVIDHWDRMILRSHAWIEGKRELYQERWSAMLGLGTDRARLHMANCPMVAHVRRNFCGKGRSVPPPLEFELAPCSSAASATPTT